MALRFLRLFAFGQLFNLIDIQYSLHRTSIAGAALPWENANDQKADAQVRNRWVGWQAAGKGGRGGFAPKNH